ncbi:ribonuclease kappa [Eudromia elegans]
MVSLLCCGPKLIACGLVLSAWGVIMLVLLGVFFRSHAAVLIEDVPATPEDFTDGPGRLQGLFDGVASNCFIAAGLYALLGGVALCQGRLRRRKDYLVQNPSETPRTPPNPPALCQGRLRRRKDYLVQ